MAFSTQQLTRVHAVSTDVPPSHQKPHDGLHMQEDLKNCWCKCVRCWLNTGNNKQGAPTGRCICMECPCHGGLLPMLGVGQEMPLPSRFSSSVRRGSYSS